MGVAAGGHSGSTQRGASLRLESHPAACFNWVLSHQGHSHRQKTFLLLNSRDSLFVPAPTEKQVQVQRTFDRRTGELNGSLPLLLLLPRCCALKKSMKQKFLSILQTTQAVAKWVYEDLYLSQSLVTYSDCSWWHRHACRSH